ncbi:MAG: NRDE family protein [Kofleriaceae bacterium]|nr:NRDE family protein [Kofleriaceae bacterium]
MCTLLALIGVVPDTPVVLAANRDELYDRPARAPVALGPGLVGGLDLRAGGSWLCVARDGRFVGVTNQREAPGRGGPAPRSRGELVRALATCPDRAAMRARLAAVDPAAYASANLLLGDPAGADVAYLRRGGTLETQGLPPGVHVLTNDRLGSPDFPRANRAAALVTPLVAGGWAALAAALPAILADHVTPPPAQVPPLPPGLPLAPELAAALQALCVHTPSYGTRSSTIAAITAAGTRALAWADGPPCTAPFVDAMPLYA